MQSVRHRQSEQCDESPRTEVRRRSQDIRSCAHLHDQRHGRQLARAAIGRHRTKLVHPVRLVGFDRDKDKKPNAQVELRIYDENKKPTLAKATSAAVPAEAPEGDPGPVSFLIPFNREGTFTAEVKATDLALRQRRVPSYVPHQDFRALDLESYRGSPAGASRCRHLPLGICQTRPAKTSRRSLE